MSWLFTGEFMVSRTVPEDLRTAAASVGLNPTDLRIEPYSGSVKGVRWYPVSQKMSPK